MGYTPVQNKRLKRKKKLVIKGKKKNKPIGK